MARFFLIQIVKWISLYRGVAILLEEGTGQGNGAIIKEHIKRNFQGEFQWRNSYSFMYKVIYLTRTLNYLISLLFLIVDLLFLVLYSKYFKPLADKPNNTIVANITLLHSIDFFLLELY